jgi:multicomponent Na+:H+ antiporter subunit A
MTDERHRGRAVRRSLILDMTARLVFPSALVLSLYLLFAGHNQPGGGFVGGLVAGAAVALLYAAGGIDDVRALAPVAPWTVLGAGLLLAAGTALVPLAGGDALLQHGKLELDAPLLGHIKVTSTLLFDTGVYAVVVGLVLMVLEAFGDEITAQADQVPSTSEDPRP